MSDASLSKLTPVRNIEIGALIPVSANGEVRHEVQVRSILFFPLFGASTGPVEGFGL
jgi:hypothetical protein